MNFNIEVIPIDEERESLKEFKKIYLCKISSK